MRTTKRLLSLALSLLVLFSAFAVLPFEKAFAATQFTDISGNLNATPLTKQQIKAMWNSLTINDAWNTSNFTGEIFDTVPSVTAPYSAGKLSDEFLQTGLEYLNLIRASANLLPTEMSSDLNDSAQHGATVLGAIDTLTHYPTQPDDMSDEFFQKGYAATTSSNISYRFGYISAGSLVGSVNGCMDDMGSNNLAAVGHRRWLLNPQLKYVGFGYAKSTRGADYIATKVFDRSGEKIDYNFVSWPASGNFASNIISPYAPWSISLNPSKYQTPDINNIKITVTDQKSGDTWVFDSNTSHTAGDNAYILVSGAGYGEGCCIIFRPELYSVESLEGVYTVEVSGLYLSNGTKTTIRYQTDFFDAEGCITHDYETETIKPTCTTGGCVLHTCSECGSSYKTNETEPLGHTEAAASKLDPTCTEKGHEAGTYCSVCKITLSGMTPIAALGHNHVVDSYPDENGGDCVMKCTRCKGTYSFATPDSFSLWWNLDDGYYYYSYFDPNFNVGDRLYVWNDVEFDVGDELEISVSDETGVEYTPASYTHNMGSFTFKKSGIYTFTISYKYAPQLYAKYTVYVEKTIITGDVDGDERVSAIDYIKLRRIVLGTYTPTPEEEIRADVNRDGSIDYYDYIIVKRIYLGTY